MGGLLDGLNIGRSAVNAARAGVQLTGNNIANADTEGYHRRRLVTSPVDPPVGSQYLPFFGGVQVDGAYRAVDTLLARRVLGSTSAEAQASTREAYMLQVEKSVSNLATGGLGAVISNLMEKFSALATAPADVATRQEVLSAARDLATGFNRAASELGAIVDGTHTEVEAMVATINRKAVQIAQLNSQIVQSEAGGQEASDMRDRRDLLVVELAALSGVTAFEDASGRMTVLLGNQALVQEDQAASLSTSQSLTDNRSQIYFNGVTGLNITSSISSGELGGVISVQNTIVDDLLPKLDQLAYDLASSINTQHAAGYGLDDDVSRGLFDAPPVGVTGSAAAMRVVGGLSARDIAAADATMGAPAVGVPGNNNNALALADLANQLLAGGGNATYSQQAANITGHVGTLTEHAMHTAAIEKDQLLHLQALQQSHDGVSLDEEMVSLVEFQRAYQAGVKVISTIDQLLGELINMV